LVFGGIEPTTQGLTVSRSDQLSQFRLVSEFSLQMCDLLSTSTCYSVHTCRCIGLQGTCLLHANPTTTNANTAAHAGLCRQCSHVFAIKPLETIQNLGNFSPFDDKQKMKVHHGDALAEMNIHRTTCGFNTPDCRAAPKWHRRSKFCI